MKYVHYNGVEYWVERRVNPDFGNRIVYAFQSRMPFAAGVKVRTYSR